MPVRTTAQMATDNWVNHLSQSTQRITAGVNAVTTAPGARAVAQRQKWLAKLTASADKWAARTGSVSLQSWQQSMIQVGIPRISQGATAKQQKFNDFMTSFLPFLSRGVDQVRAMPSTTLEDNINRAVAMIRYNHGFRRGTGGGGT